MTDPQNTLLGFTPETLNAVIDDLKSCQEIIKDNLVNDIEIYQELKKIKNKKQFAINNLVSTLDRINTSSGWKTFIQLFNIAKEDKEPITFTDVLPILNESIIPNLPWGLPPKCWLFDKPTETLFLNPGTYNINKESIIGEVIPLDAIDAEIAKRLQLGTHRDKQIMDLYLNICIAECFQKPVILAKGDPTSVERELHPNPLVDGKPLKEFVKELLKQHYDHASKILSKQTIFPKDVDLDDPLWNELKTQSIILRNEIITIKNQYLEIISGFKLDEKFSVFNDIWSFLVKNNLPEVVPPSISLLQSEKYKAYGLVKKISKGPTMATVRKEYTPWIINRKSNTTLAKPNTKKIFELARDLNLKNQTILNAAQELNINVKSHSSSISSSDAERIGNHIREKNQKKLNFG